MTDVKANNTKSASDKVVYVQMINKPNTYQHVVESFSSEGYSYALRFTKSVDAETGQFSDPKPQIYRMDPSGGFSELPMDGEFWAKFRDFAEKMAIVFKGKHIAINEKTRSGVTAAEAASYLDEIMKH